MANIHYPRNGDAPGTHFAAFGSIGLREALEIKGYLLSRAHVIEGTRLGSPFPHWALWFSHVPQHGAGDPYSFVLVDEKGKVLDGPVAVDIYPKMGGVTITYPGTGNVCNNFVAYGTSNGTEIVSSTLSGPGSATRIYVLRQPAQDGHWGVQYLGVAPSGDGYSVYIQDDISSAGMNSSTFTIQNC